MKSKGWYKIIKDEKYFDEFLGIFSDFHDYRITHMEYDCETNTLLLYLGYDTGLEGALLKFIHVRLNPVWKIMNYETMQYESVPKHFRVFEV